MAEKNSENEFIPSGSAPGFDNLRFFGQFLSPVLCDRSHHQSNELK
jgi:hypothetical protein